MDDLISRQAALDAVFNNAEHPDKAYQAIRLLPSAQKHGKWRQIKFLILDSTITNYVCTACGDSISDRYGEYNYCPFCGAKMEAYDEID